MPSRDIKISVCIVSYNQAKYIAECLQSVLDQETHYGYEIIIGDDCSTDGTRQIIEEFRQRHPEKIQAVYHAENVGATENYSTVHRLAKGEYIAHMDGDDCALPGKLEMMADVLDRHPDLNVIWHRNLIKDAVSGAMRKDRIYKWIEPPGGFTRKHLLSLGTIGVHSAMMYRASQRSRIDYSRPRMLDFYLAVECLGDGKAMWVDEFLGVYRLNAGLWNGPSNIAQQVFLEELELFLARYPEERKYTNSLLCYQAVYELAKGRIGKAFKMWMGSFHPLGVLLFLRNFAFHRIVKISPRPRVPGRR